MVKRLTRRDLKDIFSAIHRAELKTSGEIRVHLTEKIKGNVFDQAKSVFSKLRMHKTQARNGVLIFISIPQREFSIIGDVGIHKKVGDFFWNKTRDTMEAFFREGKIKEGVIAGVLRTGAELKKLFPRLGDDANELSNDVSVE